jgi:hypothetical protein
VLPPPLPAASADTAEGGWIGGDLDPAEQALAALRAGIATLKTSPFTCRKAGRSPFLRELIIPFGRSGYVALFEIEDASNVVMLAVRYQLEDDYN